MNKLLLPTLLAATLCLAPVAHAAFPTLAEKEARLLKDYRDKPNAPDLVELAHVRESRGKFTEALQTWGLLRKTFGISYSHAYTGIGDRILTYNQLADWTAKRINAKRRGPRQASATDRRQAERDFQAIKAQGDWPGDKNHVRVDLNGDGIKEVVYYKGDGLKGIVVAQWQSGPYDYVWQSRENAARDFLITGGEGQGWPEVYISYPRPNSPNSRSGHLITNGDTWIVIYN